MNTTKNQKRIGWGRGILRGFLILYLIGYLILSGGLAVQAWPDNPLRQRLYVHEIERLVTLQVTSEGIDDLERALRTIARLPAQEGQARATRVELDFLIDQLTFALALGPCPGKKTQASAEKKDAGANGQAKGANNTEKPAEPNQAVQTSNAGAKPANSAASSTPAAAQLAQKTEEKSSQGAGKAPAKQHPDDEAECCKHDVPQAMRDRLAANPNRWNRLDVTNAATILRAAVCRLEMRKLQIVPSKLEHKPLVVLWRIFPKPEMLPPMPPLTLSEQTRVAELLSELRRPASEARNTEAGKKIRPLLEGLQDADFMLLILALGGWGAAAQGLGSIAAYFGHGTYVDRWWLFYLTRPFIGATLAFAFFVILRAGLVSASASWTDINHLGYAGIAVLVGFFTTEALENMKRVAGAFFSEKGSADGLHGTKPSVEALRWNEQDELEVQGTHFVSRSQIVVNGEALDDESVYFVGPEKLVCRAGFKKLPAGGKLKVWNATPKNGVSEEVRIPVHPVDPVIDEIQWRDDDQVVIIGRRFAESFAFYVGTVEKTAHAKRDSETRIILDATGAGAVPKSRIVIGNLSDPPIFSKPAVLPAKTVKAKDPEKKNDAPDQGKKSDLPEQGKKSDALAEGKKGGVPAEGKKSDAPAGGKPGDGPAPQKKDDPPKTTE